MTKTYDELREETQELNEVRFIRAGAAVFYAAKVRESGKRLESKVGAAQQDFSKARTEKDISKKLDAMSGGLSSLGDALIAHRQMLGNLTGISVASALLAERTNKQLIQLTKGKRRR